MRSRTVFAPSSAVLSGTDQEVQFIHQALGLPQRSRILDLYCGYGRHAVRLAQLGYQVTGIDVNPLFLQVAEKTASAEGGNVSFRLCDMRNISYIQEFDAVINMFMTFGYFSDEENVGVLRRVARALCVDGLFLMDLVNRDWLVSNDLTFYWRHPDGQSVVSYRIALVNGVASMKRTFVDRETGKQSQSVFILHMYSLGEISALLKSCGFSLLQTYGGFDGRPYGTDACRMIILAKKTKKN